MNDTRISSHNVAGFNLYGHMSARLGLGQAARNAAGVLSARGLPFVSFDVEPPPVVPVERDLTGLNIAHSAGDALDGVNLFHLNPIEALGALGWRRQAGVDLRARLNTIVPFWELPVLPQSWVPVLAAMDVVLAPTTFVGDAVRRAVPETTVLSYPQAVKAPSDVTPDRARWAMADQTVVFLVSFDLLSDLQRKNPGGAIEAFRKAFGDDQNVALVIKVNNAAVAQVAESLRGLEAAVATDNRIRLITDSLPIMDLWSLYASADVFVSLHRSEGLGLPVLESMDLGKPVVVTDWSGTADFATESNSMPVKYQLVPVTGVGIGSYAGGSSEGQHWAEPDTDDAAAKMRALYDSEELRHNIGLRARASMEQARAKVARGEVFDQLLAMVPDVAGSEAHLGRARQLESRATRLRLAVARARLLRTLRLRPPLQPGLRLPGPPRFE